MKNENDNIIRRAEAAGGGATYTLTLGKTAEDVIAKAAKLHGCRPEMIVAEAVISFVSTFEATVAIAIAANRRRRADQLIAKLLARARARFFRPQPQKALSMSVLGLRGDLVTVYDQITGTEWSGRVLRVVERESSTWRGDDDRLLLRW